MGVSAVLRIEETVLNKMKEDLITPQDAADVIETCESNSQYLVNTENNHRIAHLQKCYQTYWVEYQPDDNGDYDVFNVYAHRMVILNEYTAE